MTKAILIVTSDGFGGYGDFLFALKLSQQLKNKYIETDEDVPPIYIITQPSGREKITRLKGDVEFGVKVLTPTELKDRIKTKDPGLKIDVGALIEGPVFDSDLINRVVSALSSVRKPIPMSLIPEYANAFDIDTHRAYRSRLRKLAYRRTLYSGVNESAGESGILLSDELITPPEPPALVTQLDEKIKFALLGTTNFANYQTTTTLSMQYSHDTYGVFGSTTPASHFLQVHREFSKESPKNQDVLMVGPSKFDKYCALRMLQTKLIADGYTRISFYNADDRSEEVFHEKDVEPAKTYRVIYTASMSHPSMIAATALSGPLLGATGDQSFSEAVSSDKLMVYECLPHKIGLIQDYDNALKKASANDPLIIKLLTLLRNATTALEYQQLGVLLRNTELTRRLEALNKRLRQHNDLSASIFADGLGMERGTQAKVAILRHLAQQESDQAYSLLRSAYIDPFSKITGKSLFMHALDKKCYRFIDNVLQHTSNLIDKARIANILHTKNLQGETYLAQLRREAPIDSTPSTGKASSWFTITQLAKYKPKAGTKRAIMHASFLELIRTYNDTAIDYDEKALIGLILLNKKNIQSEYHWFSPRKGLFFGSQLYTICEDTLKELGVDLTNITPAQEQEYYHSLTTFINKKPNFMRNEYILRSLSEQAGMVFPQLELQIQDDAAKDILRGGQITDPTVLRTATGFYKLNPTAIGKGGWGSVYAAKHYSLDQDGSLIVSPPLAIKKMSGAHAATILDKERLLFNSAHSDKFFERFTKDGQEYLAMPLFSGVPLDKYLLSHNELTLKERQLMAVELFTDLTRIHENDVTHHDIKPKNTLFDPVTKKMHILDFGCAEVTGTTIKYQGINTAKYAIEYMPPEYLTGASASAANDIYSMTLSLAEILGINKKDLVRARMEQALATIDDERFNAAIRARFAEEETLDETMFSVEMERHINTPVFESFIRNYTLGQYDFSPYQELLGEETFALLNSMQAQDPANRPTARACFEQLNRQLPVPEVVPLIEGLRVYEEDEGEGEGEGEGISPLPH